MNYDHTEVVTTADIREAHGGMTGPAVATIRTLLMDGHEPVVWVNEWLTDEKGLEYEADQLALGTVERETAKAWLFTQAGENEGTWLPKSEARVFTLAEGVTDVESDQRTLEDV